MSSDSEAGRMAALRLYKILDTATEKSFDDLTRLAATICEVPISLVSLVDEDRQWFKSRVGLEAQQTPREHAFCAYAILGNETMIVEDAAEDPRFSDNPLVTGNPNIRFYAGAPLEVKDGVRLGTLCVIDDKPRQLSAMQREALEVIRESVVSLLEMRRLKQDFDALQKFLPMCAWCRSVKTETEEGETWVPLFDYVNEAETVTHGICPQCLVEQKRS